MFGVILIATHHKKASGTATTGSSPYSSPGILVPSAPTATPMEQTANAAMPAVGLSSHASSGLGSNFYQIGPGLAIAQATSSPIQDVHGIGSFAGGTTPNVPNSFATYEPIWTPSTNPTILGV